MAENWFVAGFDGITLSLVVQPGASSSSFVRIAEGRLKVRIQAKAVDGAANRALMEFVAKQMKVKKASVSLLSGMASRQKIVFVKGEPAHLVDRLKAIEIELANEDRDS